MKKKWITGCLILTMLLVLAACAGSKTPEGSKTAEAGTQAAGEKGSEVTSEAGGEKGSEVTSQAAGTTDSVMAGSEDWYKAVLADEASRKQYPYYRLLDINLDGVDELFLSSTENYFIGAEDKACLMACVDGKAKTLMEIGEGAGEYWIHNPSDGTLTYYSRSSGEGHLQLYTLKNGSLNQISSADRYSPHHYSEYDNKEALYFIDGKEVSEKDSESYWEQYGNEAGAITYEKY